MRILSEVQLGFELSGTARRGAENARMCACLPFWEVDL